MADIEKHNPTDLVAPELLKDLRQIIDAARSHVATTANYELTAMYWHIGHRINNEVLKNERAEYGKQIVSQVATQLQEEYGTKGFEERTFTELPSKEVLLRQLQKSLEAAKENHLTDR